MNDMLDLGAWGPTHWQAADKTARDVFDQQARVRRALSVGPEQPNAYALTVPRVDFDAGALVLATDTAQAPVRLFSTFRVRGEQVHDLDTIRRLAGRAARRLAFAEDLVLAFGGHLHWRVDESRFGVTQRGLTSQTPGLVTTAPWAEFPADGVRASHPTELVRLAIAKLQSRGADAAFGPYALLAMGRLWEAVNGGATHGATRTHLDTIRALLGDGGRAEPVPVPPPVSVPPSAIADAGAAVLRAGWALARLRLLVRAEEGADIEDAIGKAEHACKRVASDATELPAAQLVDAVGAAAKVAAQAVKRLSASGRSDGEAILGDVRAAARSVSATIPGPNHRDFESRGIVLAMDPACFELVSVEAPSIALAGYDGGDLLMQVQEAFILRVLDPSASIDVLWTT